MQYAPRFMRDAFSGAKQYGIRAGLVATVLASSVLSASSYGKTENPISAEQSTPQVEQTMQPPLEPTIEPTPEIYAIDDLPEQYQRWLRNAGNYPIDVLEQQPWFQDGFTEDELLLINGTVSADIGFSVFP